MGLISAGVLELVMLVFQLLSADQIAQWKMVEGAIDPESVAAHFPSAGVAAALVLYTPLFMATLFAPLLIADAGQGAGKSFFYSFFGILRNFSACLTTAVLLVLMTSAAVFLTVGAGLAAGLGGATTYITPIIAILVTTIAQACVWPMYRPCRHHQGRPRHRGLLHILTPRPPQKARAVRRPSARAIPRQAPAA